MKAYLKINQAIEKIKDSDLKKTGRNDYSEYDYYTPAQVDKLVYEACKDLNIFIHFNMPRNEYGIYGELKIVDIESEDVALFTMASDIPSIKATNISQQLGGAMTYTKRYMLMNVFDIVDNNLDFDNTRNTEKREQKPQPEKWLNKYDKSKNELPAYWKIVNGAKEKNMTVKDLREFYKISKEVASELENDLK